MIAEDERGEPQVIGKTSSPLRSPNTVAEFFFWVKDNTRLNPNDLIVAQRSDESRTIGIIDEMYAYTDADSHLTNYIGSGLGDPDAEQYVERVASLVAKAQVLRNMRTDGLEEDYTPVPAERLVLYADGEAISSALGYDDIQGIAIPAGLIVQSNGEQYPVSLDSDYLLGPQSAHANASGISGLATKTSYLMFLCHSIKKRLKDVSILIFNVKSSDLLHIDEPPQDLTDEDKQMYEKLDLPIEPFDDVHYYLPRKEGGEPDSDDPPDSHILYAYTLSDVHRDLDLLLSEVPDPYFTLSAFTVAVRNRWDRGQVSFGNFPVSTWNDLLNCPDANISLEVYGQKRHATPPRMKREIRRLTSYSAFTETRDSTEVYLGEEIRSNITPGRINVIDINRVPSTLQPFVIGDVMRNLDELYRESELQDIPHLIVLIDELNTFAPSGTINPVAEQIIEIARKGRANKMALFGAQQFKSEVHKQVWGNSTLHAIGRTGSAELMHAAYGALEKSVKKMIFSLKLGEMILSFSKWRSPIKVTFPRPPYRRPS